MCTCPTESIHMLNWKCAHAHLKAYKYPALKACTCSTKSIYMLNYNSAHAQVKVYKCSDVSMQMINWKPTDKWKFNPSNESVVGVASQMSLSFFLETPTLWSCPVIPCVSMRQIPTFARIWSEKSVIVLDWKKWTRAEVEAYTCSSVRVHMLNWKHAHAQMKACTC